MRSRKLVILVALLALLGLAWGRTFVLMAAEPDACIQQSMSPSLVPWTIDPSLIQGSLLPAIPGDQNGWQVTAGRWERTARACDPEGHPFTIEFVFGTGSCHGHLQCRGPDLDRSRGEPTGGQAPVRFLGDGHTGAGLRRTQDPVRYNCRRRPAQDEREACPVLKGLASLVAEMAIA